jgi:hypothetical protein
MIRRESDRHARPLRELSAKLLEDQLRRLAGANEVIERRLGPGLHAMSGRRLYRRLGFVRLGDYLTERLGMSIGSCQSIVRCERALDRLPAIAAAFDAGEISVSRLRTIVEVATPETQELWLARARRLDVNGLAAAARAAGRDSAPRGGGAGTAACEAGQVNIDRDTAGSREAEDDPGVNVAFGAPARTVALWHWALDLVRRAAGHQEPAWRCVEYLAAEFLSGAPPESALRSATGGSTATDDDPSDLPDEASQRTAADAPEEDGTRTIRAVPDALVWNEVTAAARDALRPLGRDADPEVILTRRSEPPVLDAERDDPWGLDARLRGLIRLRRSLAWRQGRLLAVVASHHLYDELGATSMSEWCETTLGISPRRARYLISIDRRIRRLPQIADAYRRGLISWCQARHLVRIAAPETERCWLRYARRVTVRGLEDAITRAEVDGITTPPATGTGTNSRPSADPPRHTSAPAFRFDERSEAGRPERAERRIAFWAPTEVAALWHEALAACRRGVNHRLADWQCLIMMIDSLRRTWDPADDRGWRRRYRIFERDGWRCSVPGCTSRANLNAHHIEFRSRGGTDDDSNLVTLCVGHHQRGIHDGLIRCSGAAPDDLWWELGVRAPGPPLMRTHGDRIVRTGRRLGRPPATGPADGARST